MTVATTPAGYTDLDPDRVLRTLDALGLRGDGRLLQLNSYENRVFQVFLEDGDVVVAKFYRPARWSDAQILEEHAFRPRTGGRRRARRRATRSVAQAATSNCSASRRRWPAGTTATRCTPRRRQRPTRRPCSRAGGSRTRCNGLAAFWAACTWSERGDRLRTDARWTRPPLATRRDSACSTVTSCPTASARPGLHCCDAALARVDRAFAQLRPQCHGCACTATSTPATSCGATRARMWSTSTTPATARRCRTCGCCFRAMRWRCVNSWRRSSAATASFARSTNANWR